MTADDTGPRPMSDAMRRVRTLSVQGGHDYGGEGIWPVVPPIVTSSAYATHDPALMRDRQRRGEPTYNRDHFPNAERLERLVADLEGAEAGYATASGMAAISLVALALLSQGDHLVLGAGGYSDTEAFLAHELARFGIGCTLVELCDASALRAAIRPETRLLYAETISNPGIAVADIPMLASIAREHAIPLVIDNTVPSPALCQPIAHGADIVVHSVTKFLGGHHDLSAGVIVGEERWIGPIRRMGYLLGAVPGAHDASLALRGIRTLAPRMAWISTSAQQVARYLQGRPEITSVRYPGLLDGNAEELAARLMPDGYGGLMVIEFAGDRASDVAAAFVRSLKRIPYVTSLGGELTTVCYPPRLLSEHERERADGDRSLRLSIGLEDPDALIADFEQAFAAIDHN